MNGKHLQTLIWLRWRLFRNRLSRSGRANTVVTIVLLVLAGMLSVVLFVTALLAGTRTLGDASADNVLYLWNVVSLVFLFFWIIGLMTELQRSEVIALEKLLAFPISLRGAFLVNYVSSFASLTMIVFLPAMVGLCFASVIAVGPSMLVTFPLLAGFVLTITALTYQLRGWLAALMVNKRRRRRILFCITAIAMVLPQIPNLLNLAYQRSRRDSSQVENRKHVEEVEKLGIQLGSHKISAQQYKEKLEALENAGQVIRLDTWRRLGQRINNWVHVLDLVLPPGWLAYGAAKAADQQVWPGLCGVLGFCLIGGVSLRRSYQTTLRFYRGNLQADRPPIKKSDTSVRVKRAGNLVGKNVPWLGDQAAATALATLRSMLRAPEVQLLLLMPFFFGVILVSMRWLDKTSEDSEQLRPLWALGIVFTAAAGLVQLFHNQFGYDRDGFRAYVLSPSSRQNILLGKNLALAPFVVGAGVFMLVILQFLSPQHVTHFLASLFELLTAYLILCIFGNYTSILLPYAVRGGSLKATKLKFLDGLLHIAAFLVLLIAFVPIFVPLGIEYAMVYFGWGRAVPFYLILAALEFVVLVLVYRQLLKSQGDLLQTREQKILDVVTRKND